MALIDETSFDAVRAAIDISLSANDLPDKTIKLSIYQGTAENWVLARDSAAANYKEGGSTPDATKWARVQNATIYKLAALLCPVIPNIIRDDFGENESWQRKPMDYAGRAQELADLAAGELASYLETSPTTAVLPTFFTLGCGRRGA